MTFPKWKYRIHPLLAFFQSTLVAHERAEQQLGPDWVDDPTSLGVAVRPVSQMHPSHVVPEGVLHELVPGQEPVSVTNATIETTVAGDINGQ